MTLYWLLHLYFFLRMYLLNNNSIFFWESEANSRSLTHKIQCFPFLFSQLPISRPTATFMRLLYVYIISFLSMPFWSLNLRKLKQFIAWQHSLGNLMFDSLLGKQHSYFCNLSKCHKRFQYYGWPKITNIYYNDLYFSSAWGSIQITLIKLLPSKSCLSELMKCYSPLFSSQICLSEKKIPFLLEPRSIQITLLSPSNICVSTFTF